MSDYHPLEDPDYYTKRSRSLMQDDYPLEVSRLVFSETDPLLIRWHWHEEVEIEYIVSGQIYITCEEETILASQGDLVFINQNVRHFVTPTSEEPCTLYSLVVHPSFILGFGQLELEKKYITPVLHNSTLKHVYVNPDKSDYPIYLSSIQEILSLNQDKNDGYELLTKSALLRIWYQLYQLTLQSAPGPVPKTAVQDEQRVKQAILYIQEHFMETVTLEDISSSIMVIKSECCRCFKRTLNVTPFEYLMKYHILESTKRMHRKPLDSISEIAGSVGFNNTSYYNKIFKKYMDCTPTEYRNTIKKELPKLT